MNDKRYLRMTSVELDALVAAGDAAATEEVQRRQTKKPSAPRGAPVGSVQSADALRSRDVVTLERMMELLVDLKTAVSSLETKIERLISGVDDSEH